ncbi:MAG: hypothetical protein ABH824_06815 [Nanoarchaeota archaeon]|nr:hypothetical protein [Nanoarchaeota archaeon]MBU1631693.1 hypothetical protein [Nanoarchaeota archaeon]MBU1876245.1 hypothetical protein [Nanoarchaeota archaeon]
MINDDYPTTFEGTIMNIHRYWNSGNCCEYTVSTDSSEIKVQLGSNPSAINEGDTIRVYHWRKEVDGVIRATRIERIVDGEVKSTFWNE